MMHEIAHNSTRRPDADADKIVKEHIKRLHLYNEAKDATQVRVSL